MMSRSEVSVEAFVGFKIVLYLVQNYFIHILCHHYQLRVTKSRPLLGSIHLCWAQFAFAGLKSPLLGAIRLCWAQFTFAGGNSPLLGSFIHL